MKKLFFAIFSLLISYNLKSQTYTQTFIDKCSGEKKIATTTMNNGYATVSFYNQVKTFSPIEVQTGVVQTWLITTKATYEALACPVINNPIVQQTVTNAATQTATNAASSAAAAAASSAASASASSAASSSASSAASASASSAASSSASSSAASSGASSSATTTTSASTSNNSSSSQSGSSTSSNSSSSSSSSTSEQKTENSSSTSSEQKNESKSETKSESKTEEKKQEEKKEESKSEEKKEESKEKKEESKQEKKDDKKKEEKKKERSAISNPMLLSSDLSTIQSPDGRWLQSATIGISKSSLMGNKTYSANAVIMSDLKTFIVSGGYTKMDLTNGKLNAIHSYSTAFAYLNGNYMNLMGYTWIKPTVKKGVFGYNVGLINLFLKDQSTGEIIHNMSSSIVGFWTKPYQYSKKLTISPQLFTMFAPISYNSKAEMTTVNRHMGFLIGSSFDYKLSKRFGMSVNYKLSGNTTPGSPFLSNILIGSRMIL